jgi:hypothetical protein
MFLKQNICRLIAIRAKFISVLILVSTVRMLSGQQFEQLTIIISIARIQLILQLNRLRTAVDQWTRKIIIARMLSSNNKIVSSRFFEQTNFEQLIMTRSTARIAIAWHAIGWHFFRNFSCSTQKWNCSNPVNPLNMNMYGR